MSPHVPTARATRLLTSAALIAVLALSTAACNTTNGDVTGSIGRGAAATPRTDAEWRQSGEVWGERYRANTSDAEAGIKYAQALRATGQRAQAVAVLEQAAIANPKDQKLLGAYGRALADVGNYTQALEVLARAHTPDNPDWRILSVQGAVLDQLGRPLEARRYYASALKIVPNEPSVLSNLGLSYALNKELKRAETILRRAVAQPNAEPKVRQNLGLVVGLQGRVSEAESIVRADLPAEEAAANAAYLREMLAQQQQQNIGEPKKKSNAAKLPEYNPG